MKSRVHQGSCSNPNIRYRNVWNSIVWVKHPPKLNVCCLCGERLGRHTVREIRPTGFNGRPQTWEFCEHCYCGDAEFPGFNAICNSPMLDAGIAALCRKAWDMNFMTSEPRKPKVMLPRIKVNHYAKRKQYEQLHSLNHFENAEE